MLSASKVLAACGLAFSAGVTFLPMATYAASDTQEVTASVNVGTYLAIERPTDENDWKVDFTDITVGGGISTGAAHLNVKYNTTGYYLLLGPAAGYTSGLTNGKLPTDDDYAYIPTCESLSASTTDSCVAIKFASLPNGVSGQPVTGATNYADGNYHQIPSTATPIARNPGVMVNSAGDTLDLTFGLHVSPGQIAGTYSTQLAATVVPTLGS